MKPGNEFGRELQEKRKIRSTFLALKQGHFLHGIDSFLFTQRSLRVSWLSGIYVIIKFFGTFGSRLLIYLTSPKRMNGRGKEKHGEAWSLTLPLEKNREIEALTWKAKGDVGSRYSSRWAPKKNLS